MQVTPVITTIPVGFSQHFIAIATLSDGTTKDVTNDTSLTWTSSDDTIAPIVSNQTSGNGMVTGVSAGSVTITASGEANGQRFSATAQVTITNAVVTELQITPQDSSLAIGLSEQLKAEAILSDGQVLNVTANTAVSWSSSNPAVATINSSGTDKGIVTGVSAGSVTITASGEANGQRFSATAQVTITSAVMTELQITPKDSSLAIGLS
ncbi:Ig-like domain-containing protein, partial [Aeromonas cavernicola]